MSRAPRRTIPTPTPTQEGDRGARSGRGRAPRVCPRHDLAALLLYVIVAAVHPQRPPRRVPATADAPFPSGCRPRVSQLRPPPHADTSAGCPRRGHPPPPRPLPSRAGRVIVVLRGVRGSAVAAQGRGARMGERGSGQTPLPATAAAVTIQGNVAAPGAVVRWAQGQTSWAAPHRCMQAQFSNGFDSLQRRRRPPTIGASASTSLADLMSVARVALAGAACARCTALKRAVSQTPQTYIHTSRCAPRGM